MYDELFRKAKELGVCGRLHGTEDKKRLLRLFCTPQGVEFCTKNSFPDIAMCRMFKGELAEGMGVFVETDVKAQNLPFVFLVGECHAELEYTDSKKLHQVVLMHGATANIKASNWAVVSVNTDGGGSVTTEATGRAKIL